MIRLFLLLTIFFEILFLSNISILSQTLDSNLVYFRVNALDSKWEFVKGLSQKNFIVKEENKEQEITYFSKEDEPASIVMLFDISSPISIEVRQIIAKAALKFVQISNEKNDYSLIAFGREVYPLTDWGSSDAQILDSLNNIANLNLKGEKGKVLFKACEFAMDKLKTSSLQKKVIIIFTEDNSLEGDELFKKIKENVRKSNALIYPVILPNQFLRDPLNLGRLAATNYDLGEFAKLSGGRYFYPAKVVEYEEIIERLSKYIKFSYVIGYKSNRTIDKSSWQKVEIAFKQSSDSKDKIDVWSIISRNGYYREK